MYQPPKPVGGPSASQHGSQPDPGAAARRVHNYTAGASRGATAAYGSQLQPVADPNCKLVGYKLGFQDTGRLCLGWIVDGTAIANCYRVQVEKGRAPVVAIATTNTSNSCLGATEINGYTPGTSVVLMIHDKVETAFILGAAPGVLDVASRGFHDYISQASRKRVDDVHKKYLKMTNSGQMVDASAWRPIDATLAGEWGAITTTGMRVTLDDFMAQFAVNEFTGVFGFYHDSLLRVAGYNMRLAIVMPLALAIKCRPSKPVFSSNRPTAGFSSKSVSLSLPGLACCGVPVLDCTVESNTSPGLPGFSAGLYVHRMTFSGGA